MRLPCLVAEIGLAHDGDYACAMDLVSQAAEAGANAVKFQAVWADKLVSSRAPTYFHQEGTHAVTQHEFFSRSDGLTRQDYEHLASWAKFKGVDFLCTPFDVETVEWLNPLVPAFKIASADITNVPLLEAVARTGKPVYLSTGAATFEEIRAAHTILWSNPITVLHCVLSYPTPMEAANLGAIRTVGEWSYNGGPLRVDTPPHLWNVPHRTASRIGVGYSDHTLFNLDVLTTAWLLGATVIEKHFTLDKTLPGNDHYHSMDPTDLRALVAKFKELQAMIGDGKKRVLPIEEAARKHARQSWHATRDLPAGHVITTGDVVLKRPGTGLAPSVNPVGCLLLMDVKADEPLGPVAAPPSTVAA